jgi:ABC-2 type transport system ATP-binding protein
VENVLSIQHLRKQYGKVLAVNDLSLNIPKGTIYGILGPNGSGKTTTLGMVLDVVNPTGGKFEWFGEKATKESRKRIGAILEAPLFYPYLTGFNNMVVAAKIKDASPDEIEPLLKLVGLLDRKDSPFKTYSLGMKQRLAIAAALLRKPEVLILDEPTNGLDPQGIAEIRGLIKEIANSGVTILLASHLLDEVEKVCTHVAVLQKGNLLYSGPVDQLKPGQSFFELQAQDMQGLKSALEMMQGAQNIKLENGKLQVSFQEEIAPEQLNAQLHQQGISLSHLVLRKSTLEEQFLEITRSAQ